MAVEILASSMPPSTSEINEFETLIGAKLPGAYREFLLQHNGGYPEPAAFSFVGSSDGSSIDRFLSLGAREHSDLEKYLRVYRGRVPASFIPIAHDAGGNLVCIGVQGEFEGAVYFWDHEGEVDDGNADMSNMRLLACDLPAFLNGLFDVEI